MAAAYDRGKKASEAKDYQTAIKEFTSAIKANPEAPTYYLDRSAAYLRSSSETAALALVDAEAGLVLAKARERGNLIGKAQFRRAVTLYQLGRYKDAEKCFGWSKEKDPSEKMLGIWEVKVKNKIETGDGPELQVEQYPKEDVVKQAQGEEVSTSTTEPKSASPPTIVAVAPTTPKPVAVTTPPSQIRHDWYQSSDTVTLSLMVKGVPKDKAVVEIDKHSISISFPLPTGSDYNFSLDPLFAPIDAEQSSFKVLSTKIELSLRKATPGIKWHALEGTSAPNDDDASAATTKDRIVPIPKATVQGPSYPTSSKSGPKDWDKVARDLSKKPLTESKESGSKAKEEDLDLSDDEGGDPVNGFFKKLFKNADPDTRRAMMKSYTESNGTALSTNWAEVKQGKVETKPPEGMEAKEWEI